MRKSNIKRLELKLFISKHPITGGNKLLIQAQKNDEIVQTSLTHAALKILCENDEPSSLPLLHQIVSMCEEAANGVEALNQWKLEDVASQV